LAASNNASTIWSYNHNRVSGAHKGFFESGTIEWQTTTKQGSDPGAWKFGFSNTIRASNNPYELVLAMPVVASGSMVTVNAWVKKSHATDVGASIAVKGNGWDLDGISATETTAANNTDWQQLTITFTPTESGVVPIFGRAWVNASISDVYFGSIEITQ